MLVFSSAAPAAPAPKTDDIGREPTKAELEAAKEEFSKWGAKYVYWQTWPTDKTEHHFELDKTTTLDTLKHLPEVSFTHVIDLSKVELQDSWLSDLNGLVGLRSVCIFSNPRVTDAWVAGLTGLPHLTRLNLVDCKQVTDTGVKALARAVPLHAVRLIGMDISDEALRVLIRAPRLEELTLESKGVTDSFLKEVGRLHGLRYLDLLLCQGISSNGVQHLAGLKRLTTLSLGWTPVGDEGMKAVAQLENLESLRLLRHVNYGRRSERVVATPETPVY